MTGFSEADWEQVALDTLGEREWQTLTGTRSRQAPRTAANPGTTSSCPSRMLAKMRELNPQVPGEYLDQALAAIIQPKSQDAIAENFRLHQILVHGYRGISYIDSDGIEQNPTIRLISHRPEDNELLAVQPGDDPHRRACSAASTSCSTSTACRSSIIELKKAGSAHADIAAAHAQLQTYLREFPMAFRFAVLTVVSDGITARYGTPFTPLNHFAPWNVDDDGRLVDVGDRRRRRRTSGIELETLIDGLFNPERFLQLQRNFTAFDEDADGWPSESPSRTSTSPSPRRSGTTVAGRREQRQGRRRLAHPGLGQVDGDGALRPPGRPAAQAQEPDDRRRHRPQRTRRPAVRDLQPLTAARRDRRCKVTKRAQLRDELTNRTTGGIYFTTLQKFGLHRGGTRVRRRPPAAHRPAQHHRHRRRGAPQPLRRPRRLRPAHPRRAAERGLHRVHRHADLVRRPQHPGRVRPRTSTSTTSPAPSPTAPPCRSTSSRGSIKVGWSKDVSEEDLDQAADEATARARRRRARADREVRRRHQRRLRRAGTARRRWPTTSSTHWEAPLARRCAVHRVARQGVHRRRHPGDLRPPVRGDRQAAARLARRRRRQGRDQGRLLRFRRKTRA